MPSFSYMDTFREGQWRAFRRFILQERRSVSSRERVIRAEMARIGKVGLLYATDPTTGAITQTRDGIVIEGSMNCSVGKLVQAYVALGGNPLDISLFLWSNDATLPGKGFAYPKGHTYSMQSAVGDNDSNINKYKPSRVGGTRETGSEIMTSKMDLARRWVRQEMYQKRILIEERILKLSDLYQQFEEELTAMTQATAGDGIRTVRYDPDMFQNSHSVPVVVYEFDSTFRVAESDGRVPVEADPNTSDLGQFPMLMSDVDGDGNNAL